MTNPVLDIGRAEYLKARIGAGDLFADLPAWPRPIKRLPIVDVEVDWVRFSTLNHRTKAEQKREIQRRKISGLFTDDPLGKTAQTAQFEILCSQEGFSDLRNDLTKRKQQDPAVITADGILINGNRRAAALRSLFIEKGDSNFCYVRCFVLPDDATSSEILDLETELQIAKDFKESYSWINEALLIEELYEKNRDFDKLANKMHRPAAELRAQFEKIQQVNQLVSLSNGARFHIDFEPHASAFEELVKHVRGKSAQETDSVRTTYFLGTLAGVNYRDLRYLKRGDASQLVLTEIKDDPSIAPLLDLVQSGNTSTSSSDELLDDVLGGQLSDPLADILALVVAKNASETIALPNAGTVSVEGVLATLGQKIRIAAIESHEEQRDLNALEAPILRLNEAISNIVRSQQTLEKARTMDGWAEQTYISKIEQLKSAISDLEKACDLR